MFPLLKFLFEKCEEATRNPEILNKNALTSPVGNNGGFANGATSFSSYKHSDKSSNNQGLVNNEQHLDIDQEIRIFFFENQHLFVNHNHNHFLHHQNEWFLSSEPIQKLQNSLDKLVYRPSIYNLYFPITFIICLVCLIIYLFRILIKMVNAILVLRINLFEIEKVNELCNGFADRYIEALKIKLNSDNIFKIDEDDEEEETAATAGAEEAEESTEGKSGGDENTELGNNDDRESKTNSKRKKSLTTSNLKSNKKLKIKKNKKNKTKKSQTFGILATTTSNNSSTSYGSCAKQKQGPNSGNDKLQITPDMSLSKINKFSLLNINTNTTTMTTTTIQQSSEFSENNPNSVSAANPSFVNSNRNSFSPSSQSSSSPNSQILIRNKSLLNGMENNANTNNNVSGLEMKQCDGVNFSLLDDDLVGNENQQEDEEDNNDAEDHDEDDDDDLDESEEEEEEEDGDEDSTFAGEGKSSSDSKMSHSCDEGNNKHSHTQSSKAKRGVLPKSATNVMKKWLFQHLVVGFIELLSQLYIYIFFFCFCFCFVFSIFCIKECSIRNRTKFKRPLFIL